MSDKNTIDVYNQRADEYAEVFTSLKPSKDLAKFMAAVTPEGFILDLGCGPAHSSAIMQKNGFTVDPTDASAAMVSLANKTFDVNARQAEFNELNALQLYDGVWANFSLLHATVEEFPILLQAIQRALKDNGMFHIGMKTGENSARDRLGRFYTYYSQAALEQHLTKAGFEIADTRTGKERGLAGSLEPFIIMLCKKTKTT